MKAGAIVVNYGSWQHLPACLDSLDAQTIPFTRIVVIDNPTDDAQPSPTFTHSPACEIVRNARNVGFAAANNQAVAMLHDCDWVALINPDAFVAPDWLEKMHDAVVQYPACSSFGSTLVTADDVTTLDGVGDTYHVSGLVWRSHHGASRLKAPEAPNEIFSPCAAAALYRRDAFIEVDGFDEDFFCYVEDIDLGFRLRLRGHQCMHVPDAIARHVGGATSGGKHSDFSVYHGHRNLVWAYVKNMPSPLFWALMPLHVALNIVTLVVLTWRGQGAAVWRAKWHALRGLPGAWRKRREIQLTRTISGSTLWPQLSKSLQTRGFRLI
jgi:GT2 family glycosyltransferase